MSLATWKAKFYPVPASRVSKKNALQHSLRKWLGLYKTVLKRHGLERDDAGIRAIDSPFAFLDIDGSSCALCEHFMSLLSPCEDCPLTNCNKPYLLFFKDGDPRPMISALRKAIKEEK